MRGSSLGRGSASSPGYCLVAGFFSLRRWLLSDPGKQRHKPPQSAICSHTAGPPRRGRGGVDRPREGETQCTKLRHSDTINLITKISLFQVTTQTKQPQSHQGIFFFFIEGESAWKFRKEIPPLPTFAGSVIIRQTASTLPCALPSGLAVISPALVCHSSVYSALWHSW